MFNIQEYWNQRYLTGGNSGAGSYNEEAMMKATIINHWIKEYNIRTINEIGCGDCNNLLMYNIPISYTGYDISPQAIKICNERTRKIVNNLKYYFTNEYENMDFTADLCLCLDVWFHQVLDEDFNKLCNTLFEIGKWKYVIIYSTDTNSQFTPEGLPLSQHMRQREVMTKILQYPQFEVKYWISGIQVNNKADVINNVQFPSEKKFYLLARKEIKLLEKSE